MNSVEAALTDSDCAVFLVDHDEFREKRIGGLVKLMRTPVVIDCKNLFEKTPGMIYLGVGKPRSLNG